MKFGTCPQCGTRQHLARSEDGNPICGSCADANYLAEWIDYGREMRRRVNPSPSPRAMGIPSGWKLVPEEPTPEMVGAWYRYKSGLRFPDEPPATDTSDYGAYRAMLAASPQPVDREPVNSGESGDKSQ